jgi:hypothetical protein
MPDGLILHRRANCKLQTLRTSTALLGLQLLPDFRELVFGPLQLLSDVGNQGHKHQGERMARRTAIMSCKHMMDGTGWFHYAKILRAL